MTYCWDGVQKDERSSFMPATEMKRARLLEKNGEEISANTRCSKCNITSRDFYTVDFRREQWGQPVSLQKNPALIRLTRCPALYDSGLLFELPLSKSSAPQLGRWSISPRTEATRKASQTTSTEQHLEKAKTITILHRLLQRKDKSASFKLNLQILAEINLEVKVCC